MKKAIPITLFVDIGGVLLTDGRNHHARTRATKHFKLDWVEMEDRHAMNFATYEEGKLSLKGGLSRMVCHETRPLTRAQFRRVMLDHSKPDPDQITNRHFRSRLRSV